MRLFPFDLHTKKKGLRQKRRKPLSCMVGRVGLEPTTNWLKAIWLRLKTLYRNACEQWDFIMLGQSGSVGASPSPLISTVAKRIARTDGITCEQCGEFNTHDQCGTYDSLTPACWNCGAATEPMIGRAIDQELAEDAAARSADACDREFPPARPGLPAKALAALGATERCRIYAAEAWLPDGDGPALTAIVVADDTDQAEELLLNFYPATAAGDWELADIVPVMPCVYGPDGSLLLEPQQ